MRATLLFAAIILAGTGAAVAQDVPKPAPHPAVQLEQEKKNTETRKAELEQQSKKISAELEDTQKSLVDVADDIKKNEEKLNELENGMAKNKAEQDEIQGRLKKDRAAIGSLVIALERLDRTPPEALIARPGAPLETAQSAMLLQSILPNIYGRAEALRKDLARLNELLLQMSRDQEKIKTAAADLAKRQEEIAGLLKKRKTLFTQTQTDLKQQDSALREISARAQNLQDLVVRLQKREEEERTRKARSEIAAADVDEQEEPVRTARAKPTPISRPGSAQLPVSGLIRTGYGQTDDIGAESRGLTIEGRAGALVVSPMSGVVRYAGMFKNYGRIVIVEHQKEYHSLIAGLARIDTVVGQSVAAGEPVGVLAKSSADGDKPILYYELRLGGEPVNPARTFAGL